MSRRPSRQRVRDDFDGAWKNMLSERRFASFVAFFMPEIHDQIDWSRGVEFLEQELRAITRKSRRGHRSVDRLVKVWLKDGSETWVLVHVEIQSQEDAGFPLRMFQYRYRALDLFGERSLMCLAILGDINPDWRPDGYSSRFWGTEIDFKFRTVKLMDYADRLDALERSENPFARFVVAHLKTLQTQGDYETRLQWKLRLIQGLYDMGLPDEEVGQLGHDFDWLLALPDPLALRYHTTMTQFEEERAMPHLSTAERIGRDIGRKEGREEGREEGRMEGRVEGRREVLRALIAVKFGPLTDEVLAGINRLTEPQIDRIATSILTANTLDELGILAG